MWCSWRWSTWKGWDFGTLWWTSIDGLTVLVDRGSTHWRRRFDQSEYKYSSKKPVPSFKQSHVVHRVQFLCHKLFTCLFQFHFLSQTINRLILMISSVCSSSYWSRKDVGTMKRKAHVKKMTARISCLNGLRNAGLIRDQDWVVDLNHRQESRMVQKQLFITWKPCGNHWTSEKMAFWI